jgi:hypothetical protein
MAGTQPNHHVTTSKNYRRPLDQDEYKMETYTYAPGYEGSEWLKELPSNVKRTFNNPKNKAYEEETVTVRRDVAGQAMAKAAIKEIKNKKK